MCRRKVVRRQGKSGVHGVAERLRRAAVCNRQLRIIFQPCNDSMAVSILRFAVLRFELEYGVREFVKFALVLRLYITIVSVVCQKQPFASLGSMVNHPNALMLPAMQLFRKPAFDRWSVSCLLPFHVRFLVPAYVKHSKHSFQDVMSRPIIFSDRSCSHRRIRRPEPWLCWGQCP
jgi:hypothetical protein